MGDIAPHRPVLFIVAAFSRYEEALDHARQRVMQAWGPIALESERFQHDETKYYEASMGSGLLKTFFALEQLVDPASLVEAKLTTNQWELDYAAEANKPEARPLNLDPGYLTEAKLVLASTKDRDHRLYLQRGIFAENTLFFRAGNWQLRPWTYPDYQRADYHLFFTRCRDYLRQRYRTA
ncbi:MAG TPA: DUF4416 family protein [Pirellulaceae bacterium]|nr:DUF4416 family protein [Pirellulaceae bacterium]